MIEVVRGIDLLSQKTGISKNDFPPFYYKEYYDYEKQDLVYIVSEDIVLPIIFSKHYFLKKAQLVFSPLKKNKKLTALEEKLFLEKIVLFLVNQKLADRILPPPNYVIFQAYPKNSICCKFGTYFLDISPPLEELWEGIHPKHKNVIRNATKKQCELKTGKSQIRIFYDLYSGTMNRSKLSYNSLGYFSNLVDNMNEDNLLCAVAYYDNNPQGALLIPYSNFGAYYIYGASSNKVEPTGLNNYLHWEIIKQLKEKGVQRYDFVGARLSNVSNTKLQGIQKFKERFGSELEKGFLWKMDLTLKCKMYDFLMKFKNTLLFKNDIYIDIIDQERAK